MGLFIAARLERLAELFPLRVVAPEPLIEYSAIGHGGGARPAGGPGCQVRVARPRWLYPPGGTVLNVACLAVSVMPPLMAALRDGSADIIDAHFGYPEGVAACLLSRIVRRPFLVTLRGSELLHGTYPLRRLAIGWALRRAARVIAVSEELRNYAVALGVDPARTAVIPNGLDSKMFYPRPRAAARRKHDIPGTAKFILSAGHLIQLKGHAHAIRAVAALAADGVDVRLGIAGGRGLGVPECETDLKALVSGLNLGERVRFLGAVSQETLAELMSAADVFCLASDREGWPNVVHEALGCGTPVVATRVGAVAELLPGPEYGFIVPVGDTGALTAALGHALEKDWNRDGISRWGQSRSWEAVGRDLASLVEEVAAAEYIRHAR
jgi:teichuronic acid biosynthesis glycosyltransferase TuaC